MRNVYIVCYDIADQKRLQRMHKLMCGFGDPLQYSVFSCVLSPAEKVILTGKILDIINQKEDKVLFVNLGLDSSVRNEIFDFLGMQKSFERKTCIIV